LRGALDSIADKLNLFGGRVTEANDREAAAIQKATQALAAKGIVVERGTMTNEQYEQALAKAVRQTVVHTTTVEKAATATQTQNRNIEEEIKHREEAEKAAKKQREEVDRLVGSVTGETEKSRALVQALTQLDAKHVNGAVVVEKLGKQTRDYADALRAGGQEVPAIVAKFEALYVTLDKSQHVVKESNDRLHEWLESAKANMPIQDLDGHVGSLDQSMRKLLSSLEALEATKPPDSQLWKVEADRISAAFGDPFDKLREPIVVGPVHVDPNSKAEIDKMKKAMDQVGESAGHIWDNLMKGGGKNPFSGLGQMFKSEAETIGRTLYTTLMQDALSPLQKSLNDLLTGEHGLSGALKGLLMGKDGKSGLLGGLSSGLSDLFGKKLGGLMSNAFSGGLISAGISAGIVGVKALVGMIGKGHRTANEFVQNIQNPFGEQVTDIANQFFAAASTGNLDVGTAKTTVNQMQDLWKDFVKEANKFASKGSTEAKVVRQAFDTLSFIPDQLLPDMQSVVTQLQAGAPAVDDFSTATMGTKKPVDDLTDSVTDFGDVASDTVEALKHKIDDLKAKIDALEHAGAGGGSGAGSGAASGGGTDATGLSPGYGTPQYTDDGQVITPFGPVTPPSNNAPPPTGGTPLPPDMAALAAAYYANPNGGMSVELYRYAQDHPGSLIDLSGNALQPDDPMYHFYNPMPGEIPGVNWFPYDPRNKASAGIENVQRPGLYELHEGEAVIPAAENKRGGGDVQVHINIQAWDGHDVERVMRDKVIPSLTEAIRSNRRGLKDDIARYGRFR
jgi:hypothetical protein